MMLFDLGYGSDPFRHSLKLARCGTTTTIHSCVIIMFMLMMGNASNTLAGGSMKLSENDSGKTIEISVGDKLEIALPGNPTTGYVWEVSSADSKILMREKGEYYVNGKTIGAAGVEIIKFQAIAVGKNELKLIFHRPFEHNISPLKVFETTIIIKN